MTDAVVYIHGKDGSAAEAEHYKTSFCGFDVIGFDYRAKTPKEAKDEFTRYFDEVCKDRDSVILIANSIGAYFTMNAHICEKIKEAFFISPIVDMEKLITDMMAWAHVTEDELCRRKVIATGFGETLSWDYLCYVRKNPIAWTLPTHILYGEKDSLTSYETVSDFAKKTRATLDVMPGGEHWFHTDGQMAFLDGWIKNKFSKK